MQTGPLSRSRSSQRHYINHIKRQASTSACSFCAFDPKDSQIIKELEHFWVVDNIFGYDVWDGCGVLDHLMIVPKRHVHSLSDLTDKEKANYIDAISSYEARGYSVYSRSHQNITKSVAHQHTHFIKLADKRHVFLLYLRKPHLLFFK